MKTYLHKVQYYETDRMGITHHSNYIRWMEEARIDFLEQIGYGYAKLEADGIISPVLGVECRYKHSCTFDDTIAIEVWVEEFRGVKLIIGYAMTQAESGEPVAEGRTTHCFLDREGKPVILKRRFPAFDETLKNLVRT